MKPTERFTKTVQDYLKYRPSYPKEVLDVMINECQLTKQSIIADIGSGTGLLTKLLLDHSNTVYGVEPNEAMRQAAETYLHHYSNFISVNGTAEATTLADKSVDIITAATAFHWFDAGKAKQEFKRILKKPGWAVLVWNVRNIEESALMRDYENLLMTYGSDYRHSKAVEFEQTAVESFFSPYHMHVKSFKNIQKFDWPGLKGRLMSTSYTLREVDEHYEEMIKALKQIYQNYEQDDKVEFLYNCKIYYGRLV